MTIICPVCKGKDEECPECEGTGEIEVIEYY